MQTSWPGLYRDFPTQEAIDRQYDPAIGVPDLPGLRQRFTEHSSRARAELPYLPGVAYGPTVEETLDIFPASKPGSPVMLFFHGGYWRANTARDFSCVALGPHGAGMTVVVVNYALCPHVTLDEICRQARASVAWTLRNIHQYNGDASRLTIAGHSAGAHLAAICLQTRWADRYDLNDDCIRAALLISGVYDIAPLRYSYLQPLIQLDDGIIRRNSPQFGIRPSGARVLLTWGSLESSEFERQSKTFHEGWLAAGNKGELLKQHGANHFSAIHGLEDPQSPLCRWLIG